MTPEKIQELAMEVACKAVLDYGEGGETECQRAEEKSLWRDHPAYVAAIWMAEKLGKDSGLSL